jgi:hypothetical protein
VVRGRSVEPDRLCDSVVDSLSWMRNHLLMASCEALLRSGTACRSAAVTDSAFCSHHASLIEEIGEERVRSGDHSRRRHSTVTVPLVAEVETATVSGNGLADPAQVRPRLAEAAAASLDDIQAALLDAALGATRETWITTSCAGCGKKQRVEVKIPDVRSRVAAIELLLREGLGRPPQAEETPSPRLPHTAEAVAKLSWDDMQMIFAAHFASEITAVAKDGGDALLRERVAALDEGQRQLLHEALDEVKLAS